MTSQVASAGRITAVTGNTSTTVNFGDAKAHLVPPWLAVAHRHVGLDPGGEPRAMCYCLVTVTDADPEFPAASSARAVRLDVPPEVLPEVL